MRFESLHGIARVCAAAVVVALAFACAPDLREEFPFDGETAHGERVRHEDAGNGVTRTFIDASAKEAWVYFDADTRAELSVDDAFSTNAWDLAFQRFKIISNSGVNGSGTVETAVLDGVKFEDVSSAPASGYLQDASDGPDSNADVDSPFLIGDGWYFYDLLEHKLSARQVVYVVKTTEGAAFKLQMLGYYDEAGTAGRLSFQWAPLPSP